MTAPARKIESGELAQGKSWSTVVRSKGEIDYICRLHPVMKGVLVVE